MQPTRQRILEHLREHGQATVEGLSDVVGVAPVTVRHHVGILREQGLIEADTEVVGRGRPCHVFRLKQDGLNALDEPQHYARLADRLVEVLRAGDPGAPSRLFRELAVHLVDARRSSFDGLPLEMRLAALVDLLAAEGFVLRWSRDGDDYLVHEVACPYRALAWAHAEVCHLDLEVLRLVVGGGVVRDRCRRDGAPECTFRVRIEPA